MSPLTAVCKLWCYLQLLCVNSGKNVFCALKNHFTDLLDPLSSFQEQGQDYQEKADEVIRKQNRSQAQSTGQSSFSSVACKASLTKHLHQRTIHWQLCKITGAMQACQADDIHDGVWRWPEGVFKIGKINVVIEGGAGGWLGFKAQLCYYCLAVRNYLK